MSAPPEPELEAVRLIALGGLGEIGMNCLVLEHTGARLERVMIDCGVIHPLSDGIDCYHPGFESLIDEPAALSAVVLTHGHEDHIGGVPYLLKHLLHADKGVHLRVFGPPYAIELCRRRLDEHQLDRHAELTAVEPGKRFEAGGLGFESVSVTHSMFDATALIIDTPVGRIVHSGDFKFDESPLDGVRTDAERLAAIGDEGVRLLLSDSTNVFSHGKAGSEQLTVAALDRLIGEAEARVVVGLFASNLHRLEAVARAAQRHGRRLCLLGRSMYTHTEVGRLLGRLSWPSDLLVSPELAAELPRAKVVWAATGTQGEPRGALRRLASRQHPYLALEPGDRVVLSSRVIPGNERAVSAMMDDLVAQGAEVRSQLTDDDVHVTGHAHRDDQRRMIELTRPESFVPLHGTHLHLVHHAALARAEGVGQIATLLNGEALAVTARTLEPRGPVPWSKTAVIGDVVLDEEVQRERRQLAQSGVVFVAVTRAVRLGDSRVQVRALGLPLGAQVEALAGRAAAGALAGLRGAPDDSVLGEALRRAVRARLSEKLGLKPWVDVVVAS